MAAVYTYIIIYYYSRERVIELKFFVSCSISSTIFLIVLFTRSIHVIVCTPYTLNHYNDNNINFIRPVVVVTRMRVLNHNNFHVGQIFLRSIFDIVPTIETFRYRVYNTRHAR